MFPRYPGFVTLPSGVQIKDLCVGDGVEVPEGPGGRGLHSFTFQLNLSRV